jgi:hypothetical protein
MPNFAITIPKAFSWDDFMREMDVLANNMGETKNVRFQGKPQMMQPGDRMYIVYDGFVRGYLVYEGHVFLPSDWTCSTTQRKMKAGHYMRLRGPWTETPKWPMQGFQGYRRYTPPEAV